MKFYTVKQTEDMWFRVAGILYKSNDPLAQMVARDIDEQMLINKTEEEAEKKRMEIEIPY